MGYLTIRTVESLLMPPAGPMLLVLSGLLLSREPKRMLTLALFGLILLYVSSVPATTQWLRAQLEVFPPLDLNGVKAQAIVVLGADRYRNAPEYGGDTVSGLGLERLRYAARLQKQTGLPILASGGNPLGEDMAEAQLMRQVLQQEFCARVRWIELASRNTYENAQNSSRILKEQDIQTILLVTHAWHMPRALEAFRHAGLRVIPASTRYYRPGPLQKSLLAWLPNAAALYYTQLALHEIMGRLWYRLRYYNGPWIH